MPRRIALNDPRVRPYVSSRAQCSYDPNHDVTIGVVDDSMPEPGQVRGGVIYTNYSGSSIWLSVAGINERWITPDMLTLAFRYPFHDLGCAAIFAMVEEANAPVLKFDLALGFRVAARLPLMFASGDGIVVTMTRDECRWWNRPLRTVRPGIGGLDGR